MGHNDVKRKHGKQNGWAATSNETSAADNQI